MQITVQTILFNDIIFSCARNNQNADHINGVVDLSPKCHNGCSYGKIDHYTLKITVYLSQMAAKNWVMRLNNCLLRTHQTRLLLI